MTSNQVVIRYKPQELDSNWRQWFYSNFWSPPVKASNTIKTVDRSLDAVMIICEINISRQYGPTVIITCRCGNPVIVAKFNKKILEFTFVTSKSFWKSYWGGFFSVFTNCLRDIEAKLHTATWNNVYNLLKLTKWRELYSIYYSYKTPN